MSVEGGSAGRVCQEKASTCMSTSTASMTCSFRRSAWDGLIAESGGGILSRRTVEPFRSSPEWHGCGLVARARPRLGGGDVAAAVEAERSRVAGGPRAVAFEPRAHAVGWKRAPVTRARARLRPVESLRQDNAHGGACRWRRSSRQSAFPATSASTAAAHSTVPARDPLDQQSEVRPAAR